MKTSPTLQDLAEALGMHKGSVSQALSGKGTISAATRQRVLDMAREMGYAPNPFAQRLAQGGSNSTVCLFSGYLDVGLATEKILLIQRGLSAQSLEVPIYTCFEPAHDGKVSQQAQIRLLCRQRPRAIICATQRVHPIVFKDLEEYQREGGIVVSFDAPLSLSCDQVIFDREHNACTAARYLLEQGHRRLAIVMFHESKNAPGAETAPQPPRLKGFRGALEGFAGAEGEVWFFQSDSNEMGGAQIAERFLKTPVEQRPTGLCIVNDYVAVAFMAEVIRAGVRVPQDVSIISHDNQPIAPFSAVPLTSMIQPVQKIAGAVIEMVTERLAGSEVPSRTVALQGDLVVRRSVAPPPIRPSEMFARP